MIDIENDVFNLVAQAVRLRFPTVSVSGEYNDSPASFPAVTVVEADNNIVDSMRTVNIENAVSVMYEVNVFSNAVSGRKSEAKAISNLIDDLLTSRGFTRMIRTQAPNLANAKVYRIVSRYRAYVGPNGDNHFLIYQQGAKDTADTYL